MRRPGDDEEGNDETVKVGDGVADPGEYILLVGAKCTRLNIAEGASGEVTTSGFLAERAQVLGFRLYGLPSWAKYHAHSLS